MTVVSSCARFVSEHNDKNNDIIDSNSVVCVHHAAMRKYNPVLVLEYSLLKV